MNALGMWEGRLLLWIQENVRMGWLNPVMRLITGLGNEGIFWIGLIILMLFFKKTRRIAVCCAISMILTLLLVNVALKPLFARTRPYVLLENLSILVKQPGDHSFPSGHSAHSLACSWVIYRLGNKKYGVPLLILGILVALSRLYVGVHFPTDVIAGCACGMLMAEASIALCRKFKLLIKA